MGVVALEKMSGSVKWHKLFRMLRKIGSERRIIFNLYKNQIVIIRVEDQERKGRPIFWKGVRQGYSLLPLLFNVYRRSGNEENKKRSLRLE